MDSYVEVVGRVVDANTMQMAAYINLGDDLGEFLPFIIGLQFTYDFVPNARHETCE